MEECAYSLVESAPQRGRAVTDLQVAPAQAGRCCLLCTRCARCCRSCRGRRTAECRRRHGSCSAQCGAPGRKQSCWLRMGAAGAGGGRLGLARCWRSGSATCCRGRPALLSALLLAPDCPAACWPLQAADGPRCRLHVCRCCPRSTAAISATRRSAETGYANWNVKPEVILYRMSNGIERWPARGEQAATRKGAHRAS